MPRDNRDCRKLLAEVRACELCAEYLPAGPRPVLQLDPRARLLIAGQAPGRKVHESGVPFEDASGDRLREWLGLDRKAFYDPMQVAILPMGLCYPGTGKSGDLPPRPECAPAWREPLLAQLEELRLTVVLGKHAQAFHFPGHKGSVTALVQDWQSHWPMLVPLPHPSPRNNIWLRRNPWFSEMLLPALQAQVEEIFRA